MKKMTYLMMLVLGLAAVGVDARPTLKERWENTKQMVKNAKAAPHGQKLNSLVHSAKEAIERNKEDIAHLAKTVAVAAA